MSFISKNCYNEEIIIIFQAAGDDQRVVTLFLGPGDRRFGFSVVGGKDQPTPPRLDDLAPGKY